MLTFENSKNHIEEKRNAIAAFMKTTSSVYVSSEWREKGYCLFVTSYNNGQSTGIACDIPGQFFIVSSGIIGDNDITLASTFMHELGHTLG